MKRNILLGMMAFLMMFVALCSNDLDSGMMTTDGTTMVSFSVETPQIASRANGDSLKLQYAVYTVTEGEEKTEVLTELTGLRVTDAYIVGGSTSIKLNLVANKTYKVLFWAAGKDAPYTVDFENKQVVISSENAFFNEASADAFFACHEFTVADDQTAQSVTLVRPVAQLNIGTADLDVAETLGYEPEKTTVKNGFAGKTIVLTSDIDLSVENWDPIGDNRTTPVAFEGTFDGQNHTIKGAHITGDHCFNKAVYFSDEGSGLFSVVDGATIKRVKVDGATFGSFTVDTGTIAGYAYDTTFEDIEISNTKIAGYNWCTGGVVGEAAGKCTFKGINLANTVTVGTLWDSYGQNAGGIAGSVSADAEITIEDCKIACVLDVINDITSNYKWTVYRVSGMIIGNTNTTEGKYNEVVTATATNVTCKNVTVTYGEWMNYHYCQGFWERGWARYESSEYVGGVDEDEPHNHADGEDHLVAIPFDQLFGGSSNGTGHYPVKGLAEFPGVTVNYPAEYTCPVCGEPHNSTSNE